MGRFWHHQVCYATMRAMFSERTRWESSRNPLTEAWDRRRRNGLPCFDLTQSNPTLCGFSYPPWILDALSGPPALLYEPEARGLPAALEAVAEHISSLHHPVRPPGRSAVTPGTGVTPGATGTSGTSGTSGGGSGRIDPASLLLCSGTSEAYGWLLKLLCDPGDHVLVPRPSYPLLDYLADLESVSLRPYTLRYDGRWNLDLHALEDAWTPRTRAVVVIHPNNPTGNFLNRREADLLRSFCTEHDLALISDEVFLEYPLQADSGSSPHAGDEPYGDLHRAGRDRRVQLDWTTEPGAASLAIDSPCLTFSLGGLSKSCGLPQIKVGWIHAGGPPSTAAEALKRLEIVSDTYLSVNTPAQIALREILRTGRSVAGQIRRRTSGNWAWLRGRADRSAGAPWTRLDTEGGWYAVLRIPNTRTEEEWCLDLVEHHGIMLHPGYFFDFPSEAFLVASLLPEEDLFSAAMDLALGFVERGV